MDRKEPDVLKRCSAKDWGSKSETWEQWLDDANAHLIHPILLLHSYNVSINDRNFFLTKNFGIGPDGDVWPIQAVAQQRQKTIRKTARQNL